MTTATAERNAATSSTGAETPPPRIDSARETVETIAVTVIAFLLMSFEAEGFMIPTGSMNPGLMGRHKEITCPECGNLYQVNASTEQEARVIALGRPEARWIAVGTCGNCRCPARVDDSPSFRGDRIGTMKVGYELPFLPGAGPPERWHDVVFRYPLDTEIRYIKRLIGLGGEEIRIARGDVFRRPLGGGEPFTILRKSWTTRRAMLSTVYDDSHRPATLATDPRWARWAASGDADQAVWSEPAPGRFVADDRSPSDRPFAELRYRHRVPDPEQWQAIMEKRPLLIGPRSSLVTDFDAFNTEATWDDLQTSTAGEKAWTIQHWVGDLAVSLTLEAIEARGELVLELVEAGRRYQCRLDLRTGIAALVGDGRTLARSDGPVFTAPGTCRITFANVDDQLALEIDGHLPFGEGVDVEGTGERALPTALDLEPVGIGIRGASVAISGLLLKRDIYYSRRPSRIDYPHLEGNPAAGAAGMMDVLAEPGRFWMLENREVSDFAIGPGRSFMLGDNSLWSSDSRAWGELEERLGPAAPASALVPPRRPWEVPDSLIVGRAFCVYWPHAKPVWPEIAIGRDVRLPFRPYFERMKWIR